MLALVGRGLLLGFLLSSSVALAKPKDQPTPISFESASCFNVDLSAYPLATFHGPDTLDVDPLGTTLLDWSITVLLTETGLEFVGGSFTFHVGNKLLVGEYTDFSIDPLTGAYTLDWSFTGGTGRLHKVFGSGQTNGVADLSTFCAAYGFSGTLFDYKN